MFATKEGSRLCRYDVDPNDYDKPGNEDKCPKFPVYKRYFTYLNIRYDLSIFNVD